MLSVWLFVVLPCTYSLWWRAKRSRGHPLPPAYPGELPIIGHVHLFLMSNTNKLWHIFQSVAMESLRHGGVIYWNIGKLCYVITDPDDALKVANTCLKKQSFYRMARNWLGKGLLTAPGSVWQHHRKLLNPVFTVSAVHSYLELFNDQAKELIEDIEPHVGKTEFNIIPYLKEFSLRTICLTTFGRSEIKRSSFFKHFMDAIEKILQIIVNRAKNFLLHNDFIYSLKLKKEEDKVVKTINELLDGVLQKYKGTSTNGTVIEKSFMSILDHILQSPSKQSLTDLEIKDEINTIVSAGLETTSNTLVYTLVLLGSYPEIQEKLHEEVMQVLGAVSDVDKYDLQKLVYTDAVIKESLRLLPVGVLVARYIDKNVELKNYTLRAGSDCFLMTYGINRHSSWGPDAEQFKPERWLEPTSLPDNPNAFAAFSFGKRSCIGRTYAMASMKVALVHFVRKYRWTADITKLKCKVEITLQPATGHEITLLQRS